MLKVFPQPTTEDQIRKKAAKAGVPITQFLAPFLNAIADGSLVMVPHFPPPSQQQKS